MALQPGTRIGPYEVTALIGEGGMGQVYRATDTNLGRPVALKVLPDAFAADPERLTRFECEAKTLAALNHPHIAQIYGFEKADGVRALVMELVEGPTLADRLTQRAIPIDEALPIARQIAEALDAAHEQGIIHRDLKPANIKVRPDGTVKVLDFGLAKALEPGSASSPHPNLTNSPTITSPALMTGVGVLLGTAAYMSPEQAKGRRADKRSDIWAFGCVLYEMLTGKRAFEGEDVGDTLANVLKIEPDWSRLPADVSLPVRTLLKACLVKDRRLRVSDISSALFVIDNESALRPAATPEIVSPVPAGRSVFGRVAAPVAAGVLVAAAAGGAVWMATRPSPSPVVRLSVVPREAQLNVTGANPDIAVSQDSRRIAYITGGGSTSRLYLRAIDQLEATALAPQSDADSPFFSPDGNWVGFVEGLRTLKKVAATGGPAVEILPPTGQVRGASWGPGDAIVFATEDRETGLMRVSASGGAPELLTKPEAGVDHFFPEVLPDGRAVLFTIVSASGDAESGRVAVLDLETRAHKVLVEGGGQARYAASGHVIYATAGSLRAVPFDLGTRAVRGSPVPVVDRVQTKENGAGNFSLSATGTLVYQEGTAAPVASRRLVWVDRQGNVQPLAAPPRAYVGVTLSPDGTRAAFQISDQENDIWTWTIGRETLTRLTFSPGADGGGVWSPDGRRIAFSRSAEGSNIFWQAADGTGVAERLTERPRPQFPTSISPDGTRLVFHEPNSPPRDIGVVTLTGERKTDILIQTPFDEMNGEISPDGRWLAYSSSESGRYEIYVRPFPDVNGGRWQVSTEGGTRPGWAPDGRELFYYQTPGRILAVPIKPGAPFEFGNPSVVIDDPQVPAIVRPYAVSADGRRLLVIRNETTSDGGESQLVVVQGWFEELRSRVPVP